MRMHVINVGQAEAILLEFRNQAILIDAGVEIPRKSSQNRQKEYKYRTNFSDYLKAFFDARPYLENTLYGVIISHPHPDHANHLDREVLKKYKVKTLIESGDVLDEYGYIDKDMLGETKLIQLFDEDFMKGFEETAAWRKKLLDDSGVELNFLDGYRDCSDENNFSLVVHVRYKSQSFMLTGDAELDDKDFNTGVDQCGGLIPKLLTRYKTTPSVLRANVYKAGHHGSKNGTSLPWLTAIKPDYAVISAGDYSISRVGKYNAYKYGHPSEKSIKEMESQVNKNRSTPITGFTMTGPKRDINPRIIKKAIYCTCWDGNITLTVDAQGSGINVKTEKN